MWRFPDRSTSIGSTINAYLENKANMDDAVIHLLFVANRMEKRWVAMLGTIERLAGIARLATVDLVVPSDHESCAGVGCSKLQNAAGGAVTHQGHRCPTCQLPHPSPFPLPWLQV